MEDITFQNSTIAHLTMTLEGKKSFECKVCEKYFSRKTNLSRHMSSVNEGKKAFQCKICDKSFSEND